MLSTTKEFSRNYQIFAKLNTVLMVFRKIKNRIQKFSSELQNIPNFLSRISNKFKFY